MPFDCSTSCSLLLYYFHTVNVAKTDVCKGGGLGGVAGIFFLGGGEVAGFFFSFLGEVACVFLF